MMIKNKLRTLLIGGIFGILYLTGALTAQSNWHLLPNAPVSTSRFDDVFFLNKNLGWSAGSNGKIYRTTNGGINWELQYSFPASYYFRSLEFRDSLHGFAGTLNNRFLRTSDGGQTWENIANQIDPSPHSICGISVADSAVIYAVGEWNSPAFLLKSEDGGSTWISKSMSEYAKGLVDVFFVNRDTGYVSGEGYTGAVLWRTADGGENWEKLFDTGVPGQYVWKIQRVTESVWVASVQTFLTTGLMLRSEDAGNTWVALPTPISLQGIGFATPEHGWVGGYPNGFYETTDGGQNWEFVNFGGSYNRFFFLNDTLGFASGNSIYKFSAQDLSSTETPDNGVPENNSPADFHFSISPNPNHGDMLVSFDLPRADHLRISLVSSTGALTKELFNDRLIEGHHQIKVNTGKITPGAWMIAIQRNVGLHTKVFIAE